MNKQSGLTFFSLILNVILTIAVIFLLMQNKEINEEFEEYKNMVLPSDVAVVSEIVSETDAVNETAEPTTTTTAETTMLAEETTTTATTAEKIESTSKKRTTTTKRKTTTTATPTTTTAAPTTAAPTTTTAKPTTTVPPQADNDGDWVEGWY